MTVDRLMWKGEQGKSMVAVSHLLWKEGCSIAYEGFGSCRVAQLQTLFSYASSKHSCKYMQTYILYICVFFSNVQAASCEPPLLRLLLEHLDGAGETVTAPGDTTDISWAENPHCQHF